MKVLLEERLADVAVFIDTEDIPGGVEWPATLRREVEGAGAVIALIGPDWRRGAGEVDRLGEDEDWVRQELELALAAKAGKVLPVVVEDPREGLEGLPPGLESLANLQRKTLTAARWVDDIYAIAAWVADALGADAKPLGAAFPRPNDVKKLFPPLAPSDIERLVASGGLSGWGTRNAVVPEAAKPGIELYKVFEFRDFRHTFEFMRLVAAHADEMNHHPEWRNVWNRVFVSQRTWDAGHVLTGFDFMMAAYMNEAAAEVRGADSVPWPP